MVEGMIEGNRLGEVGERVWDKGGGRVVRKQHVRFVKLKERDRVAPIFTPQNLLLRLLRYWRGGRADAQAGAGA